MKKVFVLLLLMVVCGVAFATWTKIEELDEFGDPTGKVTYSSGEYSGTYSSTLSGIDNGKLYWELSIDSNGTAQILLKEGGKEANLSTYSSYSTENYTIKMKGSNGQTYQDRGNIKRNGAYYNTISLWSDLRPILVKNSSLKVVISNSKGTYSLGSVETSDGFSLFSDPSIKKGPAGGWIFYDCDSDNDSTNNGAGPDGLKSDICGWRFLEVAPTDILDTDSSPIKYQWGEFGKVFATKTGVGEGKKNTEIIASKANSKAAKACLEYSINGYDDWFMPSKDELQLLYNVFGKSKLHRIYGFSDGGYWSSSEGEYKGEEAWEQNLFGDGAQYSTYRDSSCYVRAIRAYK